MLNKNLELIIKFLQKNKQHIAIVESCTGGLLNYQFSRISGASSVYRGGIISYQSEIKSKILRIEESIIQKHSPYSFIVLDLMLKGVIEKLDSTFAIATSGIAGPNGGTKDNKVGSIYIGIQKRGSESIMTKEIFSGEREQIQAKATNYAIDFFTKHFVPKYFN